MSRAWRFYQKALEIYPIRTSAVTAGVLMTVGDAISQIAIEKRVITPNKKYDFKSSLRFLGFGLFLGGPMLGFWYRFLAKMFGGTKMATLKMVCCDQLLFAPPFLTFFLSGMEVLKGQNYTAIKQKLNEDLVDVLKTNYKIWPAVQACNFTFVPVHNRVVVVNVVAVGWNTYLAWMSSKITVPQTPPHHSELDHLPPS